MDIRYLPITTFFGVLITKGYKFKQPYIDTCKTCDAFNVSKRHTSNKPDRVTIDDCYKAHVLEARLQQKTRRQGYC